MGGHLGFIGKLQDYNSTPSLFFIGAIILYAKMQENDPPKFSLAETLLRR